MNAKRIGRAPKNFGPYLHVCRDSASLYLAGLSDGTIKVGFSNNPRSRLRSMAADARRRFGCTVVTFHVYGGVGAQLNATTGSKHHDARARLVEGLCIRAIGAVATARAPTTEYFTGITFDAAKAIVDGVIAEAAEAAGA